MSATPNKNKNQDVLAERTILIVEDDHFISKVYSKWLTLAGAQVEQANDGALGMRVALEKKIDLVLLDLGMPGLNGYDTLNELRKNPKTKDIPVIVLSNTTILPGTDSYDEIMKAGVVAILRKYETSLEEIIQRIKVYFQDK